MCTSHWIYSKTSTTWHEPSCSQSHREVCGSAQFQLEAKQTRKKKDIEYEEGRLYRSFNRTKRLRKRRCYRTHDRTQDRTHDASGNLEEFSVEHREQAPTKITSVDGRTRCPALRLVGWTDLVGTSRRHSGDFAIPSSHTAVLNPEKKNLLAKWIRLGGKKKELFRLL